MNIKKKILVPFVLSIIFSPPGMAIQLIQEVLNGSYACEGLVDFEGKGIITLGAELGATSDITSGLRPSTRTIGGQTSDLTVLAGICELHIEQVLAEFPQICTVGPVSDSTIFEPGIRRSVSFTCKAGRNNIMEVISVISRIPLTATIP